MKLSAMRMSVVLSTLGVIASGGGLLVFLADRLGARSELLLALLSGLIAGSVGLFARKITPAIRRLQRSPRVFISFSQTEADFAHRVSDALRRGGAKVWLADENIRPGEEIAGAIDKAMSESDSFLVVVAGTPRDSVLREIGLARSKGLRILPIVLGDVKVPSSLASVRYLQTDGDEEKVIDKVVEEVT